MEGSGVYDSNSSMANVLLRDEKIPCTSDVLDSTLSWVPNSSPSFHGCASSMVNFEDVNTERPIFTQIDDTKMENCNEDFDVCFHQPGKKRRLTPNQVQFLEKSFEIENKLEPERKIQLAKELALQPRQVAIWFQNRRARYKTKVLEKEYDSLKASYDKLKADYDTLCKENENMKNEPQELCDPINPLDLQSKKPTSSSQDTATNVATMLAKQEDVSSSGKSDVFDSSSDSPHYNHSVALEPGDSSHVFEADVSDFSQDEDDSFSRTLLPPSIFPKLEAECYDDDLQPNSCNLGFPVQDQGTWFWQY
ncbi:hypothetical protein DH2020_026976 [Rehmannia glutinosa]|uniref:Homeobox-leucine zipper protein n=1 Tax=Rehmannia glutinosa TaxID=99300 RepID=A0ABR0VWD7_REHGL